MHEIETIAYIWGIKSAGDLTWTDSSETQDLTQDWSKTHNALETLVNIHHDVIVSQ